MSVLLEKKPTGRSLVSEELFERLVSRIVKDEGHDRDLAERIMDQALVFLAACTQEHGAPLSPTPLVDVGWHTFILHTRDYSEFCQRIAGRMIHHVPDVETVTPRAATDRQQHTIDVILATGYEMDRGLWLADSGGNCNTGDSGEPGHCTATGMQGNENQDSKKPGR